MQTSTNELENAARERISRMGFTDEQFEFIFYDWPEGNEHLTWLLTATREEIVSWGESTGWGKEENRGEA